MYYLFYEKETDEKARVKLIYNVKPPSNMLDEGNYIMVENIKQEYGIYCNPTTREIWYSDVKENRTNDNLEEKVQVLTENLAQEKLKNIQKDKVITETAKELVKVKLEIIELKKGSAQ